MRYTFRPPFFVAGQRRARGGFAFTNTQDTLNSNFCCLLENIQWQEARATLEAANQGERETREGGKETRLEI